MKKEANLTCAMIVQQLDSEYWFDWNEKYIDEANNGNVRPLLDEVVRRLNNSDCVVVSEAYGIIHDKDEVTVWNQKEMKNVVESKAKHVHLLIKFEKGTTINNLAILVGVEGRYIEKAKSGRYGYDNMLAYLVHVKDQKKYQYKPQEVATALGEDYLSVYNRRMETWVKGRATKEAQDTQLSIDFVVSEILAGKLTKSQVLLTDDLYKIYALHKRKINEAFETAGESKSYQTIADLEHGEFRKTVIFIQGESGSGKTLLSKRLINILQKISLRYCEVAWDYLLTASTNAFDEYNGQEILFLDDLRSASLNVSDWLKLLDSYTISPISARYHNKMGAAKVIIITSTKSPKEFFDSARGNFYEDLGQFFRRIDLLVTISDDFSLFTATKNPNYSSEMNSHEFREHSYRFSRIKQSTQKNKVINKLVKTVIDNMQWNRKKTVATPAKKTTISPSNKLSTLLYMKWCRLIRNKYGTVDYTALAKFHKYDAPRLDNESLKLTETNIYHLLKEKSSSQSPLKQM